MQLLNPEGLHCGNPNDVGPPSLSTVSYGLVPVTGLGVRTRIREGGTPERSRP